MISASMHYIGTIAIHLTKIIVEQSRNTIFINSYALIYMTRSKCKAWSFYYSVAFLNAGIMISDSMHYIGIIAIHLTKIIVEQSRNTIFINSYALIYMTRSKCRAWNFYYSVAFLNAES
jgi:NO-binding membrane sensor protein with MHYT domain